MTIELLNSSYLRLCERAAIMVSASPISRFEITIRKFKLIKPKPILSLKNQLEREEYARYHIEMNTIFKTTVFSDESSFVVFRNFHKAFVFNGEDTPEISKPNSNYSVLVWAAICYKGKSLLVSIEGTVTGKRYLDILN